MSVLGYWERLTLELLLRTHFLWRLDVDLHRVSLRHDLERHAAPGPARDVECILHGIFEQQHGDIHIG